MDDLIEQLGGTAEVASALGIDNLSVVWNWKKRGVSWQWRSKVAKLAKRKRVELPVNFLEPNSDAA